MIVRLYQLRKLFVLEEVSARDDYDCDRIA